MLRLAPLLAVLVLVGCADPDTPAPSTSGTTGDTPAPQEPSAQADDTARAGTEAGEAGRPIAPGSRPETATGTIQIEGMAEALDLRLVTVEDIPLAFSTYVPDEWTEDMVSSGEGSAVVLTMGEPPLDGSVSLFVPSQANRGQIASIARAVAESRGGALPLGDAEDWVRGGHRFMDGGRVGSVRIGEHAGIPFYVVTDYPVEMGDGFPPRAVLVLDRLRWADDGTGL